MSTYRKIILELQIRNVKNTFLPLSSPSRKGTTLPRSESLAGVFGEAGQEGVKLGGLTNDYSCQGWYQGINHRKNCRAREDQ